MSAKEFSLDVLIVDDDPDIIEQHKLLLDNRAFRKQTPGRLYIMLHDAGLIPGNETFDAMIDGGKWPTKNDLRETLIINSELEDRFAIIDPDVAYSADEAEEIWVEQKLHYTSNLLGCYIAILDHDMPGKTGLDLAELWRVNEKSGSPDTIPGLPLIIFYTGRAPLLIESLSTRGYNADLDKISRTGLAEAIIQKGILRDEFNTIFWGLLDSWIKNLATQTYI